MCAVLVMPGRSAIVCREAGPSWPSGVCNHEVSSTSCAASAAKVSVALTMPLGVVGTLIHLLADHAGHGRLDVEPVGRRPAIRRRAAAVDRVGERVGAGRCIRRNLEAEAAVAA